jgi:hypothetical protein
LANRHHRSRDLGWLRFGVEINGEGKRACMKMKRIVKVLALVCGAAVLVYVGAFVWYFDVVSGPVKDDQHGWLGPVLRSNSNVIGVGNGFYYEGTNFTAYRNFRPLCKVWLLLMKSE